MLAVVTAAALTAIGLAATGSPATAAPAAPASPQVLPPGGTFVPVTPTRLVDTRSTTGPVTSTPVPNLGLGAPSGSVAAVLLNVTVVDAAGPGYVNVVSSSGPSNQYSNGNYVTGAPSATLALVPLSRFYPVTVFTSTAADVVVDVQGYVTTAAAATADTFTPVSPRRIADTRSRLGGLHPFGTGERQDLDVRGLGLLPDDAVAVVATITEAAASARTYLTAWSGTGSKPTVSNVNADRGQIVANRVLLPLAANGFAALYNNNGRTDVVVDVVGYVSPSPTGSYYTPTGPTRLTDSAATRDVTVSPVLGAAPTTGVPAPTTDDLLPTTAAWLNVVGDHPAGRGYVTARPGGTPAGSTSDLNTVPGRAVANAGPTKVGADGSIEVTASSPTRIVVDVSGWFQTIPATAPAAGIWSAAEYPHYVTSPQVTSTRLTTLPAAFAHAVAGATSFNSIETVAFGIQDGQVLQARTLSPWPVYNDAPNWFTPSRVGTLTGVTALASAGDRSYAATYALHDDGSVDAFGANDQGQLGRTPTEIFFTPLVPTAVPLPSPATLLGAAAKIGYAVLDDGSVVSWGQPRTQLGRTPGDQPWLPATVTGLTAPTAIAGDASLTYAVLADGSTVSWGQSVAPGGTVTQAAPTPVSGACADAAALQVDPQGAWELCSDGTVVQFDIAGRALGFDADHHLVASPVTGLTDVTQLATGAPDSLRALLSDGTVAVVPVTRTSTTVPTLQPRFRGVTSIGGTVGAQLTTVG